MFDSYFFPLSTAFLWERFLPDSMLKNQHNSIFDMKKCSKKETILLRYWICIASDCLDVYTFFCFYLQSFVCAPPHSSTIYEFNIYIYNKKIYNKIKLYTIKSFITLFFHLFHSPLV